MLEPTYWLIGAVSGCITGLLGGGAGLLIVPVLLYILSKQHIEHSYLMHLAIGTTFAITTVIAVVCGIAHYQNGTVIWPLVRRMSISLLIFMIVGSFVSTILTSYILIKIFGFMVLLIAVWVLFSKESEQNRKPNKMVLISMSALIGIICGSLGINPFMLPCLRKLGLNMHSAIATSVVLGTILAVTGMLTYIIAGWDVMSLSQHCIGYIYLPLFIPFAVSSSISAFISAKFSLYIPKNILKYSYAVLLIMISLKMIL